MKNGIIIVGETQGYGFNQLALGLQLVFTLYDNLIVAQPSESRVHTLVLCILQVPSLAPDNENVSNTAG